MWQGADVWVHSLLCGVACVAVSLMGARCLSSAPGSSIASRGLAGRLGSGFTMGSGIISVELLLMGYAGVPFSRGLALAALFVPVALMSLSQRVLRRRRKHGQSRLPTGRVIKRDSDRNPRGWNITAWVVATLLAGYVLMLALVTVSYGASFPDAHNIWLLKARAFFVDSGFDGDYFRSWPDCHDRRSYPPGVSLFATWIYLLIGDADSQAVKLLWIGFLLATAGWVRDSVRRWSTRSLALVAGVLTLLSPMGMVLSMWGAADLALAAYGMAAVALTLDWVARRHPRGIPWQVGIFLGFAALTKGEGAVMLVSVPCSMLLAAWVMARRAATASRDEPRPRQLLPLARQIGVACAAPMALVASWHAFLAHRAVVLVPVMPGTSERSGRLSQRLAVIADAAIEQFFLPSWMYVWPLSLAACCCLLVLPRYRRQLSAGWLPLVCFWVVAAQLGAYAMVYLLFRGDLVYLLETTAGRIPFHVWPIALCGLMLALSGPRDAGDKPGALAPDHDTRSDTRSDSNAQRT
ncbi:MAG: hypothetical protein DRQ55_12325 [Planctomycetota bacterium]|nr:MAG: hypothetical protein DRQ55_12325 [Planctomycetota bacterium]